MTETLITLPLDSLTREYPVITPEELQDSWQAYTGRFDKPHTTAELLGAAYMPQEQPKAFVSIDLCEVVRHTCASLWALEQPFGTPIANVHAYGADMELIQGDDDKITAYITALMNNGLVREMEGIDDMATLARGWREQGIYTFANTSTLPGCEEATVRFLAERMMGSLDAILFPRNYGNVAGIMNKGVAARLLIEQCMEPFPTPDERAIPVLHIDDVPYHHQAFRKEVTTLPYADVRTFQPLYPSEYESDHHSTLSPTPLGAFRAMDAHLFDRGILGSK
ncbi:MAG: hypothetical protein ACQR33_07005 [Candidatus Saccharibacteria bacterium]